MKKILTIKEKYEDKIEVSKSQFYSFLIPLSSEEEVPLLIKEKRMQFVKARHVCYAYIFNSNYKYSDDGEPSGTAGKPLYELLKKNNFKLDYNCIKKLLINNNYQESGEFVINPTASEVELSDIDLTVAGTKVAINMVEAGSKEVFPI